MAMVHQLGIKLREQIERFSGELSVSLGKVSSRFVKEALYGVISSGSVHLTKIARNLGEDISLRKTHERLCRNLGKRGIDKDLESAVLESASHLIKQDTLIVVDPSDIVKPYGKKMEYLARVHDGSKGGTALGYWLCNVTAVDQDQDKIIPLINRLYSATAPDFVSENDHILSAVECIMKQTENRGIIVIDRGGDRRKILTPWIENPRKDFIVRQTGDRHLIYRRGYHLCKKLAYQCPTPFKQTITKMKDGKTRTYNLKYGYIPVYFPDSPERKLHLAVVNGLGKEPLMLLTTLALKRSQKSVWRIVESYFARWRIEDTIRFIKQSYGIEDIRLLTYQRLRNMMALVLAASYFNCVYLGLKERLKILAAHAMKAAKRLFGIPDFNYYSIAEGVKVIFSRTNHAFSKDKPPGMEDVQLSLF